MRNLFLVICFALPMLAACSSEPNEQDLQQAYQKTLQETNAIADRINQPQMHMRLQSFKKTSCTKTDIKQQYRCKIEVELNTPLLGVQKQQGEIKATRQEDGWAVTYE